MNDERDLSASLSTALPLATPPASETVDAAWEALAFALDDYADERLADQQLAIRREVAAQLLVEHRPRIEAAIRAEVRADFEVIGPDNLAYLTGLKDGRAESGLDVDEPERPPQRSAPARSVNRASDGTPPASGDVEAALSVQSAKGRLLEWLSESSLQTRELVEAALDSQFDRGLAAGAIRAEPAGALDVAFAAVEAVLPKGWGIGIHRLDHGYGAGASANETWQVEAYADTAEHALLALAARLADPTP